MTPATAQPKEPTGPGSSPPMKTPGISVKMTPSHPGEFVRTEILEELGLSVSECARILGVPRPTLSALLNGDATLSAEMALRIEKAFGLDLDLLLRMQAWHDACHIRARTDEIAVERYRPVSPRGAVRVNRTERVSSRPRDPRPPRREEPPRPRESRSGSRN